MYLFHLFTSKKAYTLNIQEDVFVKYCKHMFNHIYSGNWLNYVQHKQFPETDYPNWTLHREPLLSFINQLVINDPLIAESSANYRGVKRRQKGGGGAGDTSEWACGR